MCEHRKILFSPDKLKYAQGDRPQVDCILCAALDGTDGVFWYCEYGSCQGGSASMDIKECERKTGKECAKFAKGRSVKWKNGINPGKGKESKFNSKMSDIEMTNKLKDLGFYK